MYLSKSKGALFRQSYHQQQVCTSTTTTTSKFARGFAEGASKAATPKGAKNQAKEPSTPTTAAAPSPPPQLQLDTSMILQKVNALFEQGQSLVNDQKYLQAELPLLSSLQLAKRLNNDAMVANISLMLGYSYNLRDSFPQAESHLKESIKILENRDPVKAGFSYSYLAEVYSKSNKLPQAVENGKHALKLLEKEKNTPIYSATQNNVAGYLHANKQYDEAQTLCQNALSFFEKNLGHHSSLTKNCRVNLSNILRDSGQESLLTELQSQWLNAIKKGVAAISTQAKKDFNKADLEHCEQQWQVMNLKRFDPPGLFVPPKVAQNEESLFNKAWNNQL